MEKQIQKLNKIIDRIHAVTNWWHSFGQEVEIAGNKYGNSLDDMHEVNRILSAYNVYLAEVVADFKVNYNNTMINRKISITERTNAINNEEAFNRAESLAKEENAELLKLEKQYEALAVKAEIMLKHSSQMMNQIQNYINYLRKEKENYNA